MLPLKTMGPSITLLALVMLLSALALTAHAQPSCVRTEAPDPPARQVFTCGNDFKFEREPTAALRIVERPGDPAPRTIDVKEGAILIEVSPGNAPTQIRTPHAIATVRGTTYVVDARADQTSVFVIEGTVNVRRTDDASTVSLGSGEGVDVALDTPLVVSTWGLARATKLLARFGR